MAGHSKWANIKRTKEAQDKKRASTFTKLSKDITVSAKLGESGDVNFNPMLRVAVDKAKAASMPNDNIQRAIDKGIGVSADSSTVVENTYEFYGPNGTAFLVDTETDNPNRTITELKTMATKNGLKMASEGSISWQFKEVGIIEFTVTANRDLDEIILSLFEIPGIIDTVRKEEEKKILVKTERSEFKSVFDSIKKQFENEIKIEKAELAKVTDALVDAISVKDRLEELEALIEENQDVVNIWTNYDFDI
ncbi:YebC/PmpR family DNA-binding transcriptional regulator [Candidatus Dojkabacteria bacterium]|uniref:Probable transcriptional regulatory protein KC669_00030 n=1 Tax=Candidatus Dojkabacteria bacterium TaxID=2099670 RepID=A0A955L979_9BACT|nr:YebC/PmpR family DNA-binding transcriptional regulator [Candidatus Dojkabacteria bacterium]